MILNTIIWLIYLKFVLNLPKLQLHNPPIPNSTNFSFPSVSISAVFKWAVSHNLGKLTYLMINIETNYQRGHCLARSTKLRRNLNRLLWVYGAQCLCYLLLSSFSVVSLRRKTVLSTLPDNLGDSGFWTISPGLQIRAWNRPNIHRSLPFSCRLEFLTLNF